MSPTNETPSTQTDPFADHKSGVRDEHSQLSSRIENLTEYLSLLDEAKPQPFEVRVMFQQLAAMKEYQKALADRIFNFH